MNDRRTKILHLVGAGGASGINSFVAALAGAIDSSRFELGACAIGPDGPGLEAIRRAGTQAFPLSANGRWGVAEMLRYFLRVRCERYDIVHCHVGARAPRVLAHLAGGRTITHVHGLPEAWAGGSPKDSSRPGDEFNAAWGIGSDAIVSCSDSLTRRISSLAPALMPRASTIVNGIDLQRWRPLGQSELRTKKEAAGLAADSVVVGFAGRLVRLKRVDCLLAAAGILLPGHPRLQFVVLGDGPLRASLEAEAALFGQRFRFLGDRTASEWLPLFDILVLPSESEGLPLAILEAMACAIPVAASDIGGISEAVVDGSTGVLVPPGDSEALAGALDALIRDPGRRSKFGSAARTRAERHFDARTMARRFEALYSKLVAVPRG